jgi:hypothetical protein
MNFLFFELLKKFADNEPQTNDQSNEYLANPYTLIKMTPNLFTKYVILIFYEYN